MGAASNSIVCPKCGRAVDVGGAGSPPVVFCPACMTRIATSSAEVPPSRSASEPARDSESPSATGKETPPSPGSPPPPEQSGKTKPEPSRVQLRKDLRGAGYARVCPTCQFELEPGDVVCPQCGHNTQTGESMAARARRRERLEALVRTAWVVVLLIGVGWVVWKTVGPSSWPWWRSVLPAFMESAPSEAESGSKLLPPSEEQIAMVRRELTERLAAACPRVADGEEVTLALRTGRVLRGRMFRTDGGVRIETRDGRVEEHAWNELDDASRLRCDDAYRAERIAAEARRKLGL